MFCAPFLRSGVEQEIRETMALPAIRVTELPEEGINLSLEILPEELSLDVPEVVLVGQWSLIGRIWPLGNGLFVEGQLTGLLQRQCVRCLHHFQEGGSYSLSAEYYSRQDDSHRGAKASQRGNRSTSSDQDVSGERDGYVFEGDAVDVTPMVREHIILGCPLQPLCHEACKGLCSLCGEDQNFVSCGCVNEPPSPLRVALLRYQEALQDTSAKSRQRV